MSRLIFRLRCTALVLAAALAVPCTVAAAPSARLQPAGTGLLQQLWAAFAGLWSVGVTPDSGCRMDPSGACLPGSAAPMPAIAPDSGCRMDPDGGCLPRSVAPAPAMATDSGCHMDPNGGCLPGS